jgi:hypothetical protein
MNRIPIVQTHRDRKKTRQVMNKAKSILIIFLWHQGDFGDKGTGFFTTATHRLTLKFSPRNVWPKTTWLSTPTNRNFLCFPAILTQLRCSRQNRRLYRTPSHNTTSMMHFKMTEALWTVHNRGRELLRGWRWRVDPKLASELTAAPVPEIMDSCLYYNLLSKKKKTEYIFIL